MTLKSWLRKFVPACIVSLCGLIALPGQTNDAAAQQVRAPLLALTDAADASQWREWVAEQGWRVVAAEAMPPEANIDARVLSLAGLVRNALQDPGIDPSRVYLAGRGAASAAVLYTASRVPDLWAAAVMLGGSPQSAVDTARAFAVNFSHVPVLWAGSGPDDAALAAKIKSSGVNLDWRPSADLTGSDVIAWLRPKVREEYPASIDCETTAIAFGRCYWVEITKFDQEQRNDLLRTTRIPPASGAALDLGGFLYAAGDPGPGIAVGSLPEKYSGPLRVGDRIVALDGKPLENARQLDQILASVTDERPAVIMVDRRGDRKRIETNIILPKRELVLSARVQAKYEPENDEIQIVTSMVSAMRVYIPPQWLPATLNWNGLPLSEIQSPGCIALWIEKELLRSGKCQ